MKIVPWGSQTLGRRPHCCQICHCEAPQGPWQSVPCAGSAYKNELPKERIAASACGLLAMTRLGVRIVTAASPPHNDRIGGLQHFLYISASAVMMLF